MPTRDAHTVLPPAVTAVLTTGDFSPSSRPYISSCRSPPSTPHPLLLLCAQGEGGYHPPKQNLVTRGRSTTMIAHLGCRGTTMIVHLGRLLPRQLVTNAASRRRLQIKEQNKETIRNEPPCVACNRDGLMPSPDTYARSPEPHGY
uniref:Uncharacterized protein n=1 Tax=Oryza glumipatula TaxID=40148 RepID=A0A0D9Z5P7_9ORYZ